MGFLSVWCLLAVVLGGRMTSATSPVLGLPGGLSPEKDPELEVQKLVNLFKPEVEKQVNQPVLEFTLVSYRTQVVAGTNYFAKVAIGGGQVVELKIYQDLQGNVSLISVL